jgi:hypothetical protein
VWAYKLRVHSSVDRTRLKLCLESTNGFQEQTLERCLPSCLDNIGYTSPPFDTDAACIFAPRDALRLRTTQLVQKGERERERERKRENAHHQVYTDAKTASRFSVPTNSPLRFRRVYGWILRHHAILLARGSAMTNRRPRAFMFVPREHPTHVNSDCKSSDLNRNAD